MSTSVGLEAVNPLLSRGFTHRRSIKFGLASVVRGHENYYAVPGNSDAVSNFRDQITRHWFKALRRRSHRARRLNWARMRRIVTRWLPRTQVRHPVPGIRFAATHPR